MPQSENSYFRLPYGIRLKFFRFISVPEMIIIIPIVLLFTISSIISPVFLTSKNLLSLLRNVSFLGIIAVVFTLLLAVKGLDLSVGAMVGLSGVILGSLVTKMNLPVSLALIITIAVGLSVGAVNGFLSAKIGIASIIVTLGMQFILRGVAFIIVGAEYIISNIPNEIVKFASYRIGPISIEVIIFIIFALIVDFILRNTMLGRRIKLSGANPTVARLHGVNYQNISIGVYIATALVATIVGILFTARMGSSMPLAGYQWELQIIIGCVLGGASIYGGRGSVIGTMLGVIFIAMLFNIMVLMNVPSDWQFFGNGLFLILAIMLNNTRISLVNRII